jgi:hypothetical protein
METILFTALIIFALGTGWVACMEWHMTREEKASK